MVKNIKIKTFLILSFLWILILMVILGTASKVFNQRLADQTIAFYEHPHTVQIEVSEIKGDMSDMGSAIKEALVYKNPAKTAETTQTIDGLLTEMNGRIAVVKKQFSGSQQLLLDADAVVVDWLAAMGETRKLLEQEQYDAAVIQFEKVYLPLEDKLRQSVTKISDYSATVTDGYYKNAQKSKVMATRFIVGIIAFTLILTVIICISVVKSIMVPLRQVKNAADEISKGNLNYVIDYSGRNEFGELAESMKVTTSTLSNYVGNIDSVLQRMANNDMTVKVDIDYVGDFGPIKKSMENIIHSLNSTLIDIGGCAEQVAGGAEQVAGGAEILAQGAAEQATTVGELAGSIGEISDHVQQNARYSEETKDLVNQVGAELERGNQQMGQMLGAISEINGASDQIAKIIKTIEDIAFQTNILALNAAVEAARAGQAGKGFAVVADEVRNLASKSADAAKSTTILIQNSITAVENGTRIANDTAGTLATVVTGAQSITDMVAKIAASSEEQASSVAQVREAMGQISQVVQTNSATSEESSATSEELSGQAQSMTALVKKFRLVRN